MQMTIDSTARSIIEFVRGYTMTSPERILAIIDSVRYLVRNDIPGDLVECGVWKGGSSMTAALTLLSANRTDKTLYLYDTFCGMTEPKSVDQDFRGSKADELLRNSDYASSAVWAVSALDEVVQNMKKTGYPMDRMRFVEGPVEQTIPETIPDRISLLRLDTDWYESTFHELTHLYPKVADKGVVIIDDYGHWQGARKATDHYFETTGFVPLLSRIDYTGRLMIKT